MSSNLISFRPLLAAPPRAAPSRKPDPLRPASKWWSPLFGWSTEPDYIDTGSDPAAAAAAPESKPAARSKFVPGGFTEEKARQLRMKTIESETFHDVMYHSSIASRLASDFKNRSDL